MVNRATESFELPLHNHEFIELTYIAEGEGFHHIDTQVIRVRKGDLCFIPIGMPHVFRPTSTNTQKQPLVVYNCIFTADVLLKLNQFCANGKTKQFIESLDRASATFFSVLDMDETIEKLFLQMHREYSLQQAGSEDYLVALLLQMLIAIQRLKEISKVPAGSPYNHRLQQFDQLLNYMEQHYSEPITLTHLAAKSLWSERHLQRLFHQHTEQSFSHYIQSLRIQKSRELLRNSQHKIAAIAELVGYKDIGHFLSIFKRITGMTPNEYRKMSLDRPV